MCRKFRDFEEAINTSKREKVCSECLFQLFLQGLIVQSALLHICKVENPKNKTPLQKGNTNTCPF